MDRMKRVSHKNGLLHIETPHGIVNIRVGLTDVRGRPVESIEIVPDGYVGERRVARRGPGIVRLVQLKAVNR